MQGSKRKERKRRKRRKGETGPSQEHIQFGIFPLNLEKAARDLLLNKKVVMKRWLFILMAVLLCPLLLLLVHVMLTSRLSRVLSEEPKTAVRPLPPQPPYQMPQEKPLSLSLQIDKTEIHHLEPVSITLKLTNHGQEEFVMETSLVCSDFDTRIDFGDVSVACLNLMELREGGGIVIPPGKTLEWRMPDRVFPFIGKHCVFARSCFRIGVKTVKSNVVTLNVRKATDEEARTWANACSELYEQIKAAEKAGDSENARFLRQVLFCRLNQDEVLSIPLIARILDEDILGDDGIVRMTYRLKTSLCEPKNISKNVEMRPVIAAVLKQLQKHNDRQMIELCLIGRKIESRMSDDEKSRYKESLKSFIQHRKGGSTYLVSILFLASFPKEYEVVEKAMQVPNSPENDDYQKKTLGDALERAKQQAKEAHQ